MKSFEAQREILLLFESQEGHFPEAFDQNRAFSRLETLKKKIESDFSIECGESREVQDGCYFGIITLKELGTGAWRPAIHLCTFGEMVAIDNEVQLIPGALHKLIDIFDQLGFVYISEIVTRSSYDGSDSNIATWWQRYFDVM